MTNAEMEQMKHTADIGAALIGGLSLASIFPPLAALVTIIWTGIRIYESCTVQKLLRRWKEKRNGTER